MEAAWPENHHPIYIPLFQRRRFSYPVDINFGCLRKSVTHPYQHKYCVEKRKISYFGLVLNLFRHLISTNQDD